MAPYSFSWNFDDGGNGTSSGQKVSHTFNKPGNYNITLAAKDSSTPSQNASANMLVTITSPANQSTLGVMTAKIDANGTNYDAVPAVIEFTANSTGGVAPYSFHGISMTGAMVQAVARRYHIHSTSLEITILH